MDHGFCRNELQAACDRGSAGIACGKEEDVFPSDPGVETPGYSRKVPPGPGIGSGLRPLVVHKHLVLFKFRRRGKKEAEWLLHDLLGWITDFCRNELQAACDRGFAGVARGKEVFHPFNW
jgi:hypothetical protein